MPKKVSEGNEKDTEGKINTNQTCARLYFTYSLKIAFLYTSILRNNWLQFQTEGKKVPPTRVIPMSYVLGHRNYTCWGSFFFFCLEL